MLPKGKVLQMPTQIEIGHHCYNINALCVFREQIPLLPWQLTTLPSRGLLIKVLSRSTNYDKRVGNFVMCLKACFSTRALIKQQCFQATIISNGMAEL